MNRRASFYSVWGRNWVLGRSLLPTLRQIGSTSKVGDVLDLGCGDSPFRDCFNGAQRYCRVDRSPIDREIIPGDMLAIPFPDGEFDTVLLFQALSDVPRPDHVLCEVRRVLRPGGRLIVFESMSYPEHDFPHDYYRLMPQGVRWLATLTGFNVDEITPLGGLFARFALLWNNFLMSRLHDWPISRPLAFIGIVFANLCAIVLDVVFPHPRLAPDYLAVLTLARGPRGEL